jgi:gamma-glutamyltranspeptidase/glutathione hydrolase
MAELPIASTRGTEVAVATADQLATQAAMWAVARGGNAVDAALAASAVLTVTAPHLCGLGGDLFALVYSDGHVLGLNASGRAGSGAAEAAEELRAAGHRSIPFRHDVRAVTVPGCVDGWIELHDRFSALELEELLRPAIRFAAQGFPASPLLVGSLSQLDEQGRIALDELAAQASRPGVLVRRPGIALVLQGIADGGRRAFYEGPFGEGLIELGDGLFSATDLATRQADWVPPLVTTVFGVELATIGPNSQGYLTLGTCRLAEAAGLPADPDDAEWPHVLIEAATAAAHDRPLALHEHADGAALLADVVGRAALVNRQQASNRPGAAAAGDTTYLCTADGRGLAVSLIQSNASGFGSWLAEPTTGINLQNRAIGFTLEPGHPAELAPGRRPPHTLSPALATRGAHLAAVLGAMGGDGQPQLVSQLAARLFAHSEQPAPAVHAGRWVLRGPSTGFDTWTSGDVPTVVLEGHVPNQWRADLLDRGHPVDVAPSWDSMFGHAQVITAARGTFAVAADPRARVGSAAAF